MNQYLKTLIIPAVSLSFLPFAAAEPYHWEIDAGYVTRDTDVDDVDVNEDNLSFEGTYYFQPVDPSGRSIHEAPFLDRASYLSLGVDIEDLDDDLDNAIESDVYRISGAFIEPETGWFGKLAYADADAEIQGGSSPDIALVGYSPAYDGYALTAGKYIFENTTLQLEYTSVDVDGDFFIQGGGGSETDTIGLGFKHYGALTDVMAYSIEGSYYWIDLEVADFEDLDDDPFDDSGSVYNFAFTVYPVRELAVGVAYADADDLLGTPYLTTTSMIQDGLGVFGEWYFTENFGVRLLYNDQSYDIANFDDINDPGEVEGDSLLFAANFRF